MPERREYRLFDDDSEVRVLPTKLGLGVFALRHFSPSAIVGEITGEIIADPDYGSDYCLDIGDSLCLEPSRPYRYVNHSCDPNCEFDWCDDVGTDELCHRRHVYLVTLRHIRPGEELTIDYNWEADAAIRCRCGTKSCRGWIVSESQVGQLPAAPERQG